MGTYVQISKQDLESWLDTVPGMRGKWQIKRGTAGMYLLPLSRNVAVQLSSTIGSRADAMGKGKASMKLSLVSLSTGRVLNKKAQKQKHYKRTLNWKKNWAKGISGFKAVYLKSADFYERMAQLQPGEDPGATPALDETAKQKQMDQLRNLFRAARDAGDQWTMDFAHSVADRIDAGKPVSPKQQKIIDQKTKELGGRQTPLPTPEEQAEEQPTENIQIERVRNLWRAARDRNDNWLMKFAESIGQRLKAGLPLTRKQQEKLDLELDRARVASRVASRVAAIWISKRYQNKP